jgi:hypothetical protein|tara:strand:+ start:372 stop:566 length:195 start_codon:yes stop_codon:yes gene_type:complete
MGSKYPWFLDCSQTIIQVIIMQVIEKTTDGIWYETSDGTECYLTNKEVDMMLEMLEPRENINDR